MAMAVRERVASNVSTAPKRMMAKASGAQNRMVQRATGSLAGMATDCPEMGLGSFRFLSSFHGAGLNRGISYCPILGMGLFGNPSPGSVWTDGFRTVRFREWLRFAASVFSASRELLELLDVDVIDETVGEFVERDGGRGLRRSPFHFDGGIARRARVRRWCGLETHDLGQDRTLVKDAEVVANSGRRRRFRSFRSTHPIHSMGVGGGCGVDRLTYSITNGYVSAGAVNPNYSTGLRVGLLKHEIQLLA